MFELSLTPQAQALLLVAAYLLGVVARLFVPYAIAYVTEPQSFDWAKAKGQLIAAAVGLVGVVVSGMLKEGFVEGLGALGFVGTFVAGYGAAAVGRATAKAADIRKKE
jgi:hypothetical protein